MDTLSHTDLCCSSPWTSGDTLAQASDLMPLLLQTVEKAVAQSSQHALLAEGVAASVLLSRLALLDSLPGGTHLSTPFHRAFSFLLGVK